MYLHELGGRQAALATISKLETNRKGRTIATLKNGARVLLQESLEEAQKLVDTYKIKTYSLDDHDLGGPSGEQLIDEFGKPIF